MSGGKGTTYENDCLKLLYNAVGIANIADNAASSPNTNLYLSLHTADPRSGNQTTSEAAYTSYARVAVARTSSGFTVSGNSVVLAALAVFPTATGGSETETWFAVGKASSGAGEIYHAGPISPTIAVSSGVTPELGTGTTITES